MSSNMNRRDFLKSAGAVTAGVAVASRSAKVRAATPDRRLNVLLILADDQRHDTIAGHGNTRISTPAMDGLARDGFSFLHAKCMGAQNGAVCVPARAMLNSGRSLFDVPENIGQFPTIGQTLHRAGYNSFLAGKWHNGTPAFVRSFNGAKNIFFGGMHGDQYKIPVRDYDPTGKYPASAIRPGNKFSSELFADAAVEFLSEQGKKAPFFCYLAFTSPHDPRTPPEPFKSMYTADKMPLPDNWLPKHPFDNGDMTVRDEKLAPMPRTEADTRQQLCDYYGMISSQDAQVARVLKTLDEQGLAENTLVLYTGDHGLAIGSHGLFGKQNIYDHSQRIPMIFRGPGVPRGGSSDAFVYGYDVFPTLCELLAVDIPASVQGKSMAGLMTGKAKQLYNSAFYAYDHLGGPRRAAGAHAVQRAIHDGRWKYHEYTVNGERTLRLFDMQNDPHEIHDLSQDAAGSKQIPHLADLLQKSREQYNDNQLKAWLRD